MTLGDAIHNIDRQGDALQALLWRIEILEAQVAALEAERAIQAQVLSQYVDVLLTMRQAIELLTTAVERTRERGA